MGVFCVNTKSQEFINTSKRLNIHPDSLEVYVHLFLNSLAANDYAEAGEDLPFPSDEQIREFFSLGNRNSGTQAIDYWTETYGATDGFITSSEVDKAIEDYGTVSVHTYKNNEGKVVHKVSRPDITSSQELKYLLEKLNIIDKDYNLLGIDMDKFYKRIDNLAIPTDMLFPVEKKILKRIALNNDTFMKAPNGKDTNLNEDQWLTVRTRAFKEWFGDWINDPANASKIVDENGEPLVVYHGTDKEFSTFNKSQKKNDSLDPGYYGVGIYFTNSTDVAEGYGKIQMPVFLNIRNPKIMSAEDTSMMGKDIEKNDGVIAEYPEDTGVDWKEYVVTEPNQIKSATGNKGTFSSANDNIYFQKSILTELKKLKQLNQPLGKAGSISKMKERLKRANLDPIITNSIIKAVEIDNRLASLTPLEIFNLITRQQEKGIAQQYNEYIQKPINEALEQHLLDFLKPFHIEALEDGVVDKYGVTGLFDILNKVIHLAKAEDRNSITVTEEVAHAIVELLGAKKSNKEENKDYTFLVDNIENTDIYKQVYEQYKDTYTKKDANGKTVPDIAKIKKEAIGQALAVAINNKWENKYDEAEKSFWDKLKEWIDKIFVFFADKDYINIDTLLNKIATEVIHNDYSRFQKVDSSNYKLLDYSESIANLNKLDGGKAVEFMQFFTGLGNIITGSIAYRKQGPVYRGKLDALHDIDMVVPLSVHGIDLKSTILQQALKTRETPAAVKEFLYNTDYFKQVMDKYPKMKIFTAYSDGEGGIVCSAVYSEDESLSERFAMLSGSYADRLDTFTEEERSKMYLFDFFIENSDREEGFIEPENNIRLSSWPIIFKAKLDMGRAKDIFDYQMWDVFEQFKSQTMSPEEYLMFQKPITYNPEQQNAIDQVSDYLAEENPKEKFFLISGRAGTGKTFIINEIIKQTTQKLGRTPKVFVTAVANKAVLNLGDKIESSHGQKATASALGYRESTDDSGHKIWVPIKLGLDVQNLPIYGSDILFIDECSMLDQAKLDMILKIQAQLPNLKIVMIGDRGQIHSIKQSGYTNDILTEEDLEDTFAPSAVFTYKNKKEVLLITRVRQGEDSPVLTFADEFWNKAVNGEDLPSHIETSTVITKNGALITQHDATGTINESIIESLIPVFKKARELGDVNYAKIVALHVELVQRYNAAMYKAFHPEGDLVNYPVSQGDMLMFYEPYGLDEDEEGNPISKFLNSSEVVVRKVLSDPYVLNTKDILAEIKKVKPSAKGLEKYENIMVLDIEVDYKGHPEKITIVCPSPDNLNTFMRLGQRLGIMGSEFYQLHNYAMMGAMKALRARLESLAANVQFNYAISAHKSQGSTYKMVIVDYRDIRGQRLKGPKYSKSERDTWGGFTDKGERAAIMYTALTRASNVTIAIDFNKAWDNPMPDVVSLNELIDAHKAGEEVPDEQFDKIAAQSNKAQKKKQKEEAPTIQPVGAKPSTALNETAKTLIEEEDEKWAAIFDEHNNTIGFEEDTHEYWYYPDGKEHPESRVKMDTSVTTITNPVDRSNRDIKDSDDYNKNGYGWLGTSAAIGTSADAVVRDFFMGIDITARKYPNFTIEQLKQLDKNLKNFKLYLDKKFAGTRYKVVTSPFALVGKITKSNGEVQTVGGTLDILIYDENGGYYIYDIKTSRTDLRNSDKLKNYTSQVNMYREMLEAMHPELKGCCNGLGILYLNTFYATPKELYAKGKTGTTRYTVDDRKQLQADGQPIEENKEYIAPHFPENDVQKAVIKIDLDVPEQFNLDKTHKPVTVSALDIEKKFKKQETHTREDNLSQATKISGSNRSFTGMMEEDEVQKIASGKLNTKTVNGDRDDIVKYYAKLRVGDILELHNKAKDQSVLVKITEPLAKNGKNYLMEFEYVKDSYAGESIQESSTENTPTRTVEDNLALATRRTIDGKETILKATMNYSFEGRSREDVKSLTTMKAIVNGERTATTRYKALDTFWLHVKEGDIVEFHDNNGGSLLVRVTKNPVKLTASIDAEEWSKKEGWSTEYFKEEVLDKYIKKGEDAYLIEYEYIDGTYVTPELQASTKFSDITISYKKDKDNYRKGTPQKNPDTAYIFTENAQAHNKLEGKEPVGPDVFVQTHVGANRGANDRVNQADIRTGFDKKKTKNAFGLIVKKYQANGTIQFVGQEGCFKDTDEDFELFKSMNIEMFDALEASKYKKMVFPFEVALGKAALPKRFATWLKKQLEVRYGIVSTVEKNTTLGYKGYGLRVSEVKKTTAQINKEQRIELIASTIELGENLDKETAIKTVQSMEDNSNPEFNDADNEVKKSLGNRPLKVVMASEHTDPSFHSAKICKMIKEDRQRPIGERKYHMLQIMTKHDGLPLLDMLELDIPKSVHLSITSLGGTKWEPGVMKADDLLDRIEDFIKQGKLNPNTTTIRIDPIIPGLTKEEDIRHIVERAKGMGIKQFKMSIMDSYGYDENSLNRKVMEKMISLGYDFDKYYTKYEAALDKSGKFVQIKGNTYYGQDAKPEVMKSIYDMVERIAEACDVRFATCGEKPAKSNYEKISFAQGCLSAKGVADVLGLKEDAVKNNTEEGNLRVGKCHCLNGKVDALAYNDTCLSACAYCYAEHGSDAALQYYNEDGTLKDSKFTLTRRVNAMLPSIGPETKINIYSGAGENADLSNFANRPFTINGISFESVEQGFQYGKFDILKQVISDAYTDRDSHYTDIIKKIDKVQQELLDVKRKNFKTDVAYGSELRRIGKTRLKATDSDIQEIINNFFAKEKVEGTANWENDKTASNVMKRLLLKSFSQLTTALNRLLATGNATLTHVLDTGKWGKEFPRLLMEVRKELRGNSNEEISFDEDGNPETIAKVNGVTVTESSGDYPQRTKENAEWSDITLDLTESDKGSGGRNELTKRVAGDKYIHFKLTDEGDNTYDTDEILAAIKEAGLPTENIKLNIAGSEIGKLKSDQERYNEEVTRLLKGLQGLGVTISEIRSGGQTGIDEAGIIAAQRLGIKASVHAPKGFKFRGADGTDVSDKLKFLARFEKKAVSSELLNLVSLVFKRNPELAEIGTEEEYAEYLETIYPESVDKNVYWHGSNEDFSEGFESAKRSTGSGAPETQSRNDFYLAKQAWTVLQYVNGVNRKGVDKNGFAHWNKLFWELKEIMSNGRRENNDWKNIVIGDASLRQRIPNKKGIFNRDKGGTNGKWLSERKADYDYEDKTDKEFFEDIFGIEWNKDTFGSWIERNAKIFKALEDNQSGIYPALINVRNPIRESGENTYYEEQRGLMSKADKEGFDAILGEQTDNEFNSDIAVVLNIGESKKERDERIHFLGTKEDKNQFRDFVDKKHGRPTQAEYDRIENEKQQALLDSLQLVTVETEEAPSKPLYTPYEEELIRQREALNSLADKDAIFRPSELRDLAKSCMYLVSDFISRIQSNKDNNSEWFQYLPDSPRKQELLATDFTKMERIEICHKLGMTMYEVIRQKYFNAANNPKGSEMKRSMRKKLTLINQNWNAFLEMGQEVVARLEQVEFDNTKVQIINGSEEEVFNGQNAEEISEIQGSTVEHWQVSFRQVSAHASLSQLIKLTLGTLFELDENGEKVISDYGVPQRVNESLAVNQILMWTQGAENLSQMVEKLKAQEEKNPWIKQITEKLEDSSEDETFKAQFWSNFKKYFQPYIIQYQKPVIGADGKPTGDTVLTNKVINQRGLEKEMIDDFMVLQQDRMAGETTMTLYNVGDEKHEAGTLNETLVKLYGEDLKKIDTYLKAIEEDSEDVSTTSVREAIKRLYNYFEIQLDEDTVDAIVENPDALNDIFTHALYIKTRKGLDRAVKNKVKDFDIIEDHRNDLETLFKYVVNGAATTLESVSYEDGKLHYSYVTPSYLSNLIDRLKGNIGNEEDSEEVREQKFQEYLENNFGKYEWFKLNGDWRNDWLEVLANDELARKELQHAVVLTTRPMKATTSIGYRDKSPMLYAKSMIQNYFYGGENSKWAFYRIPIMSNKPSEEYIRFIRYAADTYKDDIADRLINVALQEIDRISTVRQRNDTKGVEKIKSFDKNGTKFLFLDYLQPILEEYQEWKKTHENEDLYYAEDEDGIVSNERLLLGQMLEQRIQGIENYDNEDLFKKVLKSVIKQSMQEKFKDYLRDMQREGLLERDEAGNYIHLRDIDALNTAKENTREGKQEMVEEALENFFWNDTFAAINILQLTVTDIAYYKNAEDLQKRLAQIHAPGLRGNKNARWKVNGEMQAITDGKTRTIYIADFDKVVSDAIENIKRVFEAKVERLKKTNPAEAKQFEEQAKHIISAFEDINVTDAQGYNSPSSYRKKAIAFGKWSDELETLYQKIREGKYDTRDLQAMMLPLKPFVYSNASKESVGRLGTLKVGMQNKNSEYLLLMMDAILQGEENEDNPNKSKLAAIYQVMEESHYDADGNYKTDGIDTVQFNSTVKAGEMGVIDINSASTTQQAKKIIEQAIYVDVNNKSLGYNLDRVHVLDFDDYCIQNEVPAHLEGKSIFGSQMRILSISDMPEMVGGVEQFINFRGKPGSPNMVSLRQLKQDYMQAIADNIEQSMKEIIKKFNIKGTRAERNVALSKLLLEQIKGDSRFGYDLLYSVCTDEKGNFNIPLSDPINAGRVQQLLHSIIKTRINKQMILGGPVVLVTNFGTSKELDIVFKDANGNRLPTLREWFATQDFGEYNSISYEEFAVMHRYADAKKDTEEYNLYHNTYLPLRDIVSKRFKEEVTNKQAGIMYIECYAPSTVFKDFADENGFVDFDKIPEEMKELIGFRIPTEFKYSMAPLKIVGLLPSEAGEGIMLPKDITTLSGSDFDVDKLYIIRPVVRLNTWKIRKEYMKLQGKKYDNKAIWDDIYATYPEVLEEINKAQDEYYKIWLASGNTGSKEDYLEHAKSLGITKLHQWLVNSAEVFEKVMSTWDNIDDYVISDGIQMSFKEFVNSKKGNAEYYEKVINDHTKDGRDNLIFDTIYAMLTSEQAMDLIFTPGNFDEPKKYGYMAEALRLHPEMSYEEVNALYNEKGVDGLKDLIAKSKNLVYNNVHLAFHKLNMVAGKLIGIFAQNNVSHSIISLIDQSVKTDEKGNVLEELPGKPKLWRPTIYIENPILEIEGEVIGGGEVPFDTLEDKKGNRISNTLAAFLAASVDAVKDPVLNFMNINETTAGILTSLVRMGYSTELSMLFLTQPIIKDVITKYAIANEEGYKSLDLLIQETIDEINENGIDISSLDIPSLSKKSLIKTLRAATPEENINLLRALQALNGVSRVTSAIVSITKFNSVTAAAGPMLSNTMLMRQRVADNLEMGELLTESMQKALGNPIIKTFREKEFEAVDSLFRNMLLQANPQFELIVGEVQKIANGTLDDAMVNKLQDFYIAFLLARGENPIFKRSGNMSPISEARRKYIYRELPWKIKKLQKASDNRFLKLIKVMPADDAHEYFWLKLNTRGMNGTVHDDVGLYWQELYQENPFIAMDLIEYNFVTSGLGFTPNSFANLIPVALKRVIPNYMQLLSNPNTLLNTEEVNRLIDQFFRNNHTNNRLVKNIFKLEKGCVPVYYLSVDKYNEEITTNDKGYVEWVQYGKWLYKKLEETENSVKYVLASKDSSKIKDGTVELGSKDVTKVYELLLLPMESTLTKKNDDAYYEYVSYEGVLFVRDGIKGDKIKYVPTSKLGGKYGEILEINPSGEVNPIDLKLKKVTKKKNTKKKKDSKAEKLEENGSSSLGIEIVEEDNYKKPELSKQQQDIKTLIEYFINVIVPENERKTVKDILRRSTFAAKKDKAAPFKSLNNMLSRYAGDIYNSKLFAKYKDDLKQVLKYALDDIDKLTPSELVKRMNDIEETLININPCD